MSYEQIARQQQAREQINKQVQTVYEDYKKIKGFKDVGYLLEDYVVSGGEVTKDPVRNDTVHVTDIVASLNDNMLSREGHSFSVDVPNTTYYLDFNKDGDWHWGLTHEGVDNEDYLAIASVTTNAAGLVQTITDLRGHVGGTRFKDEFGLDQYAKQDYVNAQLAETANEIERLDIEKAPQSAVDNLTVVKADVNYVNDLVSSVSDGTPEAFNNLAAIIAAYPTGDSKVKLNLEDGYVYKWDGTAWVQGWVYQANEVADESVTPRKTNFIELSNNLYNADTAIAGYTVNSSGNVEPSSNYALSDFIEVSKDSDYITDKVAATCRFDENKIYINVTSGATFNTYNAKYVRLIMTVPNYPMAQLNKGTVLQPYDKFYQKIGNGVFAEAKKEHSEYIEKSPNLLDISTVVDGKTLDSSGNPADNPSYSISDFIEVDASSQYGTKNVVEVNRYNANMVFINKTAPSYNGGTFSTTAVTKYVRVVLRVSEYDRAMVVKGTSLPEYKPYGYYLKDIYVPGTPLKEAVWGYDRFVVGGKTDMSFTSAVIPETVPADHNSTTFKALNSQLAVDYPNYVTKHVMGVDSIGEEFFYLDFNPKPVPTEYVSNERNRTKIPKMILISGVHGEERAGAYCLYYTLKQICERWREDELLETLRWNVRFIVVPVVNSWGFNNMERTNQNGVDIARNFPYQWSLNPSVYGDRTWGGPSPLSEIETQYVAQIMQDNNDAIYFTSFHNFATSDNFLWNAGASKLQVQLGKRLVSRMTHKWQKEYPWINQSEDYYIGYADGTAPYGSEGLYAMSLGIQGSTFEMSRILANAPDGGNYSSLCLTLGTEAFTNWLLLNLRENVDYYNQKLG